MTSAPPPPLATPADFFLDFDLAKMLGGGLNAIGVDMCEAMIKGSEVRKWTLGSIMPSWATNLLGVFSSALTDIANIYSQIPVQENAYYFVTPPVTRESPAGCGREFPGSWRPQRMLY